jgi:hypothetical protein
MGDASTADSSNELELYPSSVLLFYEESKAARDAVDQLLIRYRANTTAVLALATGTATFFGVSSGPKGFWFVVSLLSYGIAALSAASIYWPRPWRVNVAYNVAEALSKKPPTTSMKLQWDLALGHQQAIQSSLKLVAGPTGQAMRFRVLVLATACVVIFAGVNSYLESQHPVTAPPTHVLIDPTHIETQRATP